MSKPLRSTSCFSLRSGMTLLELLVVIGIIVILSAFAIPNIYSNVPINEVRHSISAVETSLQRARLEAANSQKPVRVVIDCRPEATQKLNGCSLRLESSRFKSDGTFEQWQALAGSQIILSSRVALLPHADSTAEADTPANIYWMVFFPASQVKASLYPFQLVFAAKNKDQIDQSVKLFLSVNALTGRTIVEKP